MLDSIGETLRGHDLWAGECESGSDGSLDPSPKGRGLRSHVAHPSHGYRPLGHTTDPSPPMDRMPVGRHLAPTERSGRGPRPRAPSRTGKGAPAAPQRGADGWGQALDLTRP